MHRLVSLALTWVIGAAPALAEEPAPTRAEILAMSRDENARYKQDKIKAAIEASSEAWRPKDVYELLDLGASPEVLAIAAKKATMFWDGSARSLPDVRKAGRDVAPETVRIASNEDLVVVFEHFNDVKYGLEGETRRVGPLQPRQPYEDDVAWDMRARAHEVALAAAIAPWEGRIANTTFEAELTGGFTPHDGRCTRAHVLVDLSQVSFDLFRYTMGGLRVEVPLQVAPGSNVERAAWSAAGKYRFEATSEPVCVSAAQAGALSSQGSKLKITMRRALEGDTWTATASFHNAKTGAKL